MTIIKQSREFTKPEIYLLTKSPSVKSISKVEDGVELTPTGWLLYKDINSREEEVEILSVIGTDALGVTQMWACQSKTFKESFIEIDSIFESEVGSYTVKKISGVTKAGRDYINCELVISL